MRLLALAFLASAGVALADTTAGSPPGSPAKDSDPQSIWRFDKAKAAEHLQSGLVCPPILRDYARNQLALYDRFGLDVSCNYAGADKDLTVYVTRRRTSGVDEDLAEAKRELLEVRAERHPKLISETRTSKDGLDWVTTMYAEDGGVHSGIWMADLKGWTLEYRATYRTPLESAVMTDIAALTDTVRKSAGVRTALCAKSSAPVRQGRAITDKDGLQHAAMLGSLVGGAAGLENEKSPKDVVTLTWCPEQSVERSNASYLFWRGVADDGSDARADRITAMTVGSPPVLDITFDPLLNLVDEDKGKPAADRWSASMRQGGKTWIYGYYEGRPSPDVVTALFADILSGKAKPLAGYGAEGNSLNITLPP
jgi:hypothetical protein